MGIFDKALALMGYSENAGLVRAGGLGASAALASPWHSGFTLDPVITKDLGLPYGASVSALDAYKVPAISKGLALYAGTAANCTVIEADAEPVAGWINETEGAITPGMRMAALISDLILFREGVWFIGRDAGKQINGGVHIPRDMWAMTPEGTVTIAGVEMPAENVIYFQSLRPLGLLTAAADSIDHYHDLARTIRSRGKNPIPMVEIHITEEANLTAPEIQKVVDDWSAARQSPNGAVAVTPPGVELKMHAAPGSGEYLLEARNAARLDAANFLNLPAALLEGNSGASGTYENTLQNKDEYVSLSLAEWTLPIEQRLSQADVFGRPVRLDVSKYTVTDARGNTGKAVAANPARTESEILP